MCSSKVSKVHTKKLRGFITCWFECFHPAAMTVAAACSCFFSADSSFRPLFVCLPTAGSKHCTIFQCLQLATQWIFEDASLHSTLSHVGALNPPNFFPCTCMPSIFFHSDALFSQVSLQTLFFPLKPLFIVLSG